MFEVGLDVYHVLFGNLGVYAFEIPLDSAIGLWIICGNKMGRGNVMSKSQR